MPEHFVDAPPRACLPMGFLGFPGRKVARRGVEFQMKRRAGQSYSTKAPPSVPSLPRNESPPNTGLSVCMGERMVVARTLVVPRTKSAKAPSEVGFGRSIRTLASRTPGPSRVPPIGDPPGGLAPKHDLSSR